jgi:hypothetical protein
LSLDANPFLRHHVIGGNPVLPTVNAIGWMAGACEQLYPGYSLFNVEQYQVLKGIVFDDEHGPEKQYLLELEETAKDADSVSFKAMVSSQMPNGRPRFHYRAEITLRRELPDAPLYANFDLSESQPISADELYGGGALFHGPYYQGIERVLNISPQKLTLRCLLPAIPEAEQGQFPVGSFNPFIADGQYQSLVVWARHFHNAGSLPLQAGHGEQFRPIPFDEVTYVSMEVVDSSPTKLVANIFAHDEAGRIYNQVLNAEVTISPQLNHLFAPWKEN